MTGPFKPLLVSLLLLSLAACHPAREELTWESFFHEPWPDPLHEQYEEMFGKAFPNPSRQHFATHLPFSDVTKYEREFDGTAIPGARAETESGGGRHAISLQLPESAGKPVAVKADDKTVRLTVDRPRTGRRYRVYRSDNLVLPLPAGADPATARVVRDGDWVRITFHARKP